MIHSRTITPPNFRILTACCCFSTPRTPISPILTSATREKLKKRQEGDMFIKNNVSETKINVRTNKNGAKAGEMTIHCKGLNITLIIRPDKDPAPPADKPSAKHDLAASLILAQLKNGLLSPGDDTLTYLLGLGLRQIHSR